MKTTMMMVALAAGAAWADVSTNVIVNGASDWTSPASYSSYTLREVPQAGDVVVVPDGVSVSLAPGPSFDLASSLSRIQPGGASAILTIDTGSTDLTFAAPFTAWTDATIAGNIGRLVKRGSGRLTLNDRSVYTASGTRYIYSYHCDIRVEEGTLEFPQDLTAADVFYYAGPIWVSAGAVLKTCNGTSKYGVMLVRGLGGEGVVTNAVGTASNPAVLQIYQSNGNAYPHQFSGRIAGGILLKASTNAQLDLLGEESDYLGHTQVDRGTLGVVKLGDGGTGCKSSLGTGNQVWLNAGGGIFRYLGAGETSARTFVFAEQTLPGFIDGGVVGGLTLSGQFQHAVSTSNYLHSVNFIGSNTTECVFNGKLLADWRENGGRILSLGFTKDGSGTWRFAENALRINGGVVNVHGGTLKFDSFEEAGRICALGLSTNRHALGVGVPVGDISVDYAHLLGVTNPATWEAVFEYSGSRSVAVSTRPAQLVGDAHIRNNGNTCFRFAGVSAATAGMKKLYLDGASVRTNEVADVSNGAGQVAVVKAGPGTWALGGDLTFTGPIDVQEGKLIVRRVNEAKYTWFRWTVRNTIASGSSVNLEEFCLYDGTSAYARQNIGLRQAANLGDPQPGEFDFPCFNPVMVQKRTDNKGPDGDGILWPKGMFDASGGNYGGQFGLSPLGGTSWQTLNRDKPSTWIPLVMRLTNGAPEVASYDYCTVYASNAGYGDRAPGSYLLEGSVDGLHWDVLDDLDADDIPRTTASWYYTWSNIKLASGIKAMTAGTGDYVHGRPIASRSTKVWSVLPTPVSVRVATGASLEADGCEPEINRLQLDAAGGGSLKGFRLAQNGTLEVTNVEGRGTVNIPVDFGVAGLDNLANWTLSVNDGAVRVKYRVAASANAITLNRPGTTILLR